MKVLTDFSQYSIDEKSPLFLGLGNFDGLHLGHQELIRYVVKQAHTHGGKAAVLTFQNHPQELLHPDWKPSLLMSPTHKLYQLSELGIDICFWIPFTTSFAQIQAQDFVSDLLVKQLGVQDVCMGFNARFGFRRQGDGALMHQLSREHGFKFEHVKPVQVQLDDQALNISSSQIRDWVGVGDFSSIQKALGRPYGLVAKVIRGDGRGRQLGFPTANLDVQSHCLPPGGVYPIKARRVQFQSPDDLAREGGEFKLLEAGPWQDGVLNAGYRPTFKDETAFVFEAHLMDYEGTEFYEEFLEIQFFPRIREEKAFDGPEQLKVQINSDIQIARDFFAQSS